VSNSLYYPNRFVTYLLQAMEEVMGQHGLEETMALANIDALRNVQFVMKNGEVFKRNGVITIDKLLHPGPVNGFRRR